MESQSNLPFLLGDATSGLSEIIAGHRYSTGKPSASSVASTRIADLAFQVGKRSTRSRNFLQELASAFHRHVVPLATGLNRTPTHCFAARYRASNFVA